MWEDTEKLVVAEPVEVQNNTGLISENRQRDLKGWQFYNLFTNRRVVLSVSVEYSFIVRGMNESSTFSLKMCCQLCPGQK